MDLCLAIGDVDWSLTKDAASVLGSVVAAVGVGGAIYFGFQGLKTWRTQFKGTSDHQLARNLLIEAYKFKASMIAARDIGMSVDELDSNEIDEISACGEDRKRYAFTYSVYKRRLINMENTLAPMRALMIEAQATWGVPCIEPFNELIKMKDQWWTVARRYASAMNPLEDAETRERYAKAWIAHKGVLYDQHKDDQFSTTFDEKLSLVEAFLRKRLL